MKRQIITLILALALTIGAQAQQDDGMDAMLAAMIATKIHQDSIDTSSSLALCRVVTDFDNVKFSNNRILGRAKRHSRVDLQALREFFASKAA